MSSTKRRKGKKQQDELASLKRKAQQVLSNADTRFILTPDDEAQMSDLLAKLVEPYHSGARTTDRYRTLLTLGSLAWNAALLPDHEQQKMIDDVLKDTTISMSKQARGDLQLLVRDLVTRKKTLFSEYKRVIISFDLKDTGKEYRLSVASSMTDVPLRSGGESQPGACG